jgi:selenium metabolism protein YedF
MLLVLGSATMGEGELDLGEKLLRAFLSQLAEGGVAPAQIICLNSGIFLTTEGTPVLDLMQEFEKAGSEVISCGTCLSYYGRAEKLLVGKPGTMRGTVDSLLSFGKVLRP